MVRESPASGRPGVTLAAWAPALLSAALVVAAAVGAPLAGMSLTAAVDGFVVTNATMGLAFPCCGLILATRRPSNPIGWLFLAAGLGHAVTAAAVPAVVAGVEANWPAPCLRLLTTVGAYAWPWSIALFLPSALLLFPDGRPTGPYGRYTLWTVVATAPLFVAEVGTDPSGLGVAGPPGYLSLAGHADLMPLWTIAELRTVGSFAACLAALVARYRRGGERERRQLLWLILAVLVTIGVLVPWGLLLAGPALLLLAIPLIGVAVTVAILRHQLLDIQLVVSRAIAYALLSGIVIAAYLALVTLFDRWLRHQVGLGTSVLATLPIAVAFNPLRVGLQRLVDRAVYGHRSDPVRAVSSVSATLVDSGEGLAAVPRALRSALRLPFAALRDTDGEIAVSGTAPPTLHAIPLSYGGQRVGDLVVGARAGERELDTLDQAILRLLAAPLAVALFATALSSELQHSRERIVGAREEERRRLRRDLHDGLGPALAGITIQADLVRGLMATDPAGALERLADLRNEASSAIRDIRRVAYGLRPPALDELGLLAALRQQITQLGQRPDGSGTEIDVDLPPAIPPLPAAVEAAAYLITVEAITNALRHARAGHVRVSMRIGQDLSIEVRDDGTAGSGWSAGVGMRSMKERAAELGGVCEVGPSPHGGVVTARLPLWTQNEDGNEEVSGHQW